GVLAAAIGASALVAWFAHRGSRMDDHPLCRRCGFDLFGKPEESLVCSECGASLKRRRSIRLGRREPCRRLLTLALLVLTLCLSGEAWLGWRAASATDWNRHKPV